MECGDGAVGDGDGLSGEGVAGAVGSEGEGVNAVLHGDIAEVFAIQERAAGGGIVDFDLHRAHAVDWVAVLVGEDALVVDFRWHGVGDGCEGEQRGGEECRCFHMCNILFYFFEFIFCKHLKIILKCSALFRSRAVR